MSLGHVTNVVGLLLAFVGLCMLAAGGVAALYGGADTIPIGLSAALTLAVGTTLYRSTRFDADVTVREGFAIVAFSWGAIALFGAVPYLATGVLRSPVAAVFESMSGFTTTGATVFADIDALPRGILFWRSLTHWIGGMGIVVLAVAVLPFLGVGGMQLFQAEVPGPTPERLRPRITQTAKLLWLVYVGLTLLQTVAHVYGGMGVYDAINHSFSTVATGGFSTRNASMGAYSPYHQWVAILFMYLAGMNFTLHFRAASGRFEYWRDHEWRFYTLVVLGAASLLLVINAATGAEPGATVEAAARDALFTATATLTTTGFVTTDWERWAPSAQTVILALMFVGGMAGSTAGSLKAVRVLLLLKQTAIELRKQLHPRAVLLARIGRKVVREDVLANVMGFVILYVLLFVAGAWVLTLLGVDLITAVGASATSMGNVGPGLNEAGPMDNYGWMSPPMLAVLTFLMLVGRLEIYTVLLLFHPDMWKRRKSFR